MSSGRLPWICPIKIGADTKIFSAASDYRSFHPDLAGLFQAIGPSIRYCSLVTMDCGISHLCILCPAVPLVYYLLACQIKSLASPASSQY